MNVILLILSPTTTMAMLETTKLRQEETEQSRAEQSSAGGQKAGVTLRESVMNVDLRQHE